MDPKTEALIPGNEECARCREPLSVKPEAVRRRLGRRDVLCLKCARRHNLPATKEIDAMVEETMNKPDEVPTDIPKVAIMKLGHLEGMVAKLKKEATALASRKEAIAKARGTLDAEEADLDQAIEFVTEALRKAEKT